MKDFVTINHVKRRRLFSGLDLVRTNLNTAEATLCYLDKHTASEYLNLPQANLKLIPDMSFIILICKINGMYDIVDTFKLLKALERFDIVVIDTMQRNLNKSFFGNVCNDKTN